MALGGDWGRVLGVRMVGEPVFDRFQREVEDPRNSLDREFSINLRSSSYETLQTTYQEWSVCTLSPIIPTGDFLPTLLDIRCDARGHERRCVLLVLLKLLRRLDRLRSTFLDGSRSSILQAARGSDENTE